jgi:hypothetical protein
MHRENSSASWKCFCTDAPGGSVVAVAPGEAVVEVPVPNRATPLDAAPPQATPSEGRATRASKTAATPQGGRDRHERPGPGPVAFTEPKVRGRR